MPSAWSSVVALAMLTVLAAVPAPASGQGDRSGAGGMGKPPGLDSRVSRTVYDGVTDDLLTGGLGRTGLAFASPAPAFADPENPTAAELRRLAIYNNYRALVDTTEGGGYGRLYGPNVAADGTVTDGAGLIAGVEVIAFGRRNVTMMVQVPDSFDPASACIVTAPSSGSRGIYGAIGTSGEWGLKNGCAVAYTDKGTGTGAHDLQDDTVGLIDGIRADAEQARGASTFTARLSDRQRARFNAETPDRFAFKHAHSQLNPEQDWGSRSSSRSTCSIRSSPTRRWGPTTRSSSRPASRTAAAPRCAPPSRTGRD
jgi:hydroxybutyrate-dimer hydrolase